MAEISGNGSYFGPHPGPTPNVRRQNQCQDNINNPIYVKILFIDGTTFENDRIVREHIDSTNMMFYATTKENYIYAFPIRNIIYIERRPVTSIEFSKNH